MFAGTFFVFKDKVRTGGLAGICVAAYGCARFIAEFFPDAPILHLADASGQIPNDLGGSRGVPLTLFYRAGGELSYLHFGVIDERTLALQVDELVNG